MKKIPLRTCVVSLEKLPKNELVRIVRTPDEKVMIDESGKMNGRGAYLKKDIEIINKAKKNKVLNKHLGCEVEDNVFDELINLIS